MNDGDSEYDWAIVRLKGEPGNYLGWLPLSADTKSNPVSISGYPADKPYGTLWRSTCPIEKTKIHELYYRCETHGGMSGSAVIANEDGHQVIRGVHAYGGSTYNSGTRITGEVSATIANWIRANP